MRVCTLNPCYATLEPQGFLVERRRNGRGDLVGGIFDRIGRQMRIPRSSAPVFAEQCLGSLARLLAADLAQHQSRVAAGHGGRQVDFRVSARLKRSEAARRSLRTRPTGRPT
jgi:hypothetical protein